MTDTTTDTFDSIVADITPETDASGFPVTEGRRSFKYSIQCDTLGDMGGWVFAPDPFKAETIARKYYDLPDDEPMMVKRLSEGAVDGARYSKGTAARMKMNDPS